MFTLLNIIFCLCAISPMKTLALIDDGRIPTEQAAEQQVNSPPIDIIIEEFVPERDEINLWRLRYLIVPTDSTILSGLEYRGIVSRYRARNTTMRFIGSYQAHMYHVEFLNNYTVELLVHNSLTIEEADYLSYHFAYKLGQVPPEILSGLLTFTVFVGEGFGDGPSGAYTEHILPSIQSVHDEHREEVLLHSLTHGSLDYASLTPSNNHMISIRDNKTVNTPTGLINQEEWLKAAALDKFYLSPYAASYPMSEDIAETLPAYLALYWRPERFHSSLLNYLSDNLSNRLALIHELNLMLP